MKKIMIVLACTIMIPFTSFAGEVVKCQITKMMLSTDYHNKLFITTNGAHIDDPGSNSTWQFVLDLSDNISPGANFLYSTLLSAFHNNTTVTIIGSGEAGAVHTNIETFVRIEIIN